MDETVELSNIVKTFEELEGYRNQLLCDNEDLVVTVTDLENTIEELETLRREDKQVINEKDATIENLKRENKNLQTILQRKDQELTDVRGLYEDLADLEKENDCLLQEKNHCEIQLSNCEEKIVKLGSEIEDKCAAIERLENQLNQMQMKFIDYKKKFEALIKENEADKKRCQHFEQLLQESKAEINDIKNKLQQCELAKYKLEDVNKKNQAQIKQLKNTLAVETAKHAKFQVRLGVMEEEQNENKREINYLKDEISMLNRELIKKENEVDHCNEELERKKGEFEKYKDTIATLKDKIMINKNVPPPCDRMIGSSYNTKFRSNHSNYSHPPTRRFPHTLDSNFKRQSMSNRCVDRGHDKPISLKTLRSGRTKSERYRPYSSDESIRHTSFHSNRNINNSDTKYRDPHGKDYEMQDLLRYKKSCNNFNTQNRNIVSYCDVTSTNLNANRSHIQREVHKHDRGACESRNNGTSRDLRSTDGRDWQQLDETPKNTRGSPKNVKTSKNREVNIPGELKAKPKKPVKNSKKREPKKSQSKKKKKSTPKKS